MSTVVANRPADFADSKIATVSFDRVLIETLRKTLKHSGYAELSNVYVEAHEGYVRLTGQLPNFYLKQVAQSLVHKIAGVELLRNDVVVD